MRLFSNDGGRGLRAFTMVEIALSLAVVAFALVAIMGVLPTGMTVQKDNREDIIINQEGRYWLDAIRTGARGLDDLTNYVESIAITNSVKGKVLEVKNGPRLLTTSDILGLLCTPRVDPSGATNRIYAQVKAITGPAVEKGPLTNEFSFRYQLQTEIARSVTAHPNLGLLATNLYDVRLILRWPVVQRGAGWHVGNNRKTFRAMIAGSLEPMTNLSPFITWTNAHIFVPNKFNG